MNLCFLQAYPLIELYQNVKQKHEDYKKYRNLSFNRTILECKKMYVNKAAFTIAAFNRTILECKIVYQFQISFLR